MISDFHTHSSLSYCAEEGMTPGLYKEILSDPLRRRNPFEVDKVFITDHGMAIYFPKEIAWAWQYMADSSIFDAHRERGNAIIEEHLQILAKYKDCGILPGIEVEMMDDGRFTLDPAFRKSFKVLIGSIHYLHCSQKNGSSPIQILEAWESHTMRLLDKDIDLLGHPFRWLHYQIDGQIPPELIKQTVDAAISNDVALELNSHYKIPADIEMLKYGAEKGAVFAFSTDSHRPAEICDFNYHASCLESAGLKISDIKLLSI